MSSLFEQVHLEEEEMEEIIEKAKDWALMHGAGMRSREKFSPHSMNFAPFTLFPTPLKRKYFEEAISLQLILGELMHKVAHDQQFLTSTLEKTVKSDDFTKRLFDIYETVYREGIKQAISLEMTRSDYLEDTVQQTLKQVEFNTIACSFSGMSSTNVRLQSYILEEIGHQDKLKNLPENDALQGFTAGFIEAWKLFNVEGACILFVVEDITYNICDQRFLEFEIRKQEPKIKVIRRNFNQLHDQAKLGPNKELYVGKHRIAIVYYRCGYDPAQYNENAWDVRLLMERSDAIKCPNIQFHLAGAKKIQEVLSRPGVLERFIDRNEVKQVKKFFTDIYPLDEAEPGGTEAQELLKNNPEDFVLKPQREGGGNNIYGKDISEFLTSQHDEDNWRSSYIVMRMIRSPTYRNCIVRPNGPNLITETISELGIYSVVIGTPTQIIYKKQTGHMLRTKPASFNEGGVASGFGSLDSPYLI